MSNDILFRENICILIYNARIVLRRINYLDIYIKKRTTLEEMLEFTGSKRGLVRYSRRLVRVLSSLIKMLDIEEKSMKQIIGKSDKIHEVMELIAEIEKNINESYFRGGLKPAETLKEEKF